MVAIKTDVKLFLSLALMLFVYVAFADVSPRIVALGGDEQYMQLLRDVDSISSKEDKLIKTLDEQRTLYNRGGADVNIYREEIVKIEQELLDLRVQRSAATNKINLIEQQWSLDNMDTPITYAVEQPQPSTSQVEHTKYISHSSFAENNLPSVDLNNLRNAEDLSQQLSLAFVKEYISNYQELARLKQEYDQAPSQEIADSVRLEYEKVDSLNLPLASIISTNWRAVSESKEFAYALLMETAGYTNYFEVEEKLKVEAAEMVDSLMSGTQSVELLEYYSSNLSMTKLEIELARHLQLPFVLDSLSGVRDSLHMAEFNYPSVELEERLFIDFEPIKFSTKAIYTGANPIPNGKVYERGVIYRLLVGKFKQRQAATLFRGAYPISIIVDKQGLLCYYLGGYQTLEQAEEAREMLLKHGFRRPEVVEWRDGISRNLTAEGVVAKKEPQQTSKYRVEITGATELSESVLNTIKTLSEDKELLKIGASLYIVRSFDTYDSASQLVDSLELVDKTISATVAMSNVGSN